MAGKLNLIGQRFGRLIVIDKINIENGSRKNSKWLCQCDCGNTTIVAGCGLRSKKNPIRSCGCLAIELRTKHGLSNTRLYNVWISIKDRCLNPNNKNFHNYGKRGITICDEWKEDFLSFYEWAMENGYDEEAPRGQCTIDRIDNNGDYSPDNCRFITHKEQCNNTRRNVKIEYNGQLMSYDELSAATGLKKKTIEARHQKHDSPDRIVRSTDRGIKIDMFELNGKYLRSFNSASDAARYMNNGNPKSNGKILACARGLKHSYKGYLWRFSVHSGA